MKVKRIREVEPRSTFTFVRGLSNIASILFMHVKLRDTGNQPLDCNTPRI